MKRKIAFFLTIIMLCAVLLPVQVFAEEDKTLQSVVAKVKQLFTIPGSYTFSPEAYTDGGKKIWSLNWSGKDGDEGSINVRVDEKGTIISYDNWKPYDYSVKKLPKYSSQEAEVKAEQFISKVNPSALSQVKLMENSNNALMDYSYYVTYIRVINKIPFYNNTITVSVNRETGEIQNYSYNWNDDVTFGDASKAIDMDAAKKAYAEKLGLKLIYKYNYENDKLNLYAVYTPKYGSQYAIDALTGEKIQCDYGYFDVYGGGSFTEAKAAMDTVNTVLTPEEIKAIDELSNMISQADAEKIARGIKYLKLTDDFKLASANLSRNWPIRSEYVWYLNFNKESGKSGGSSNYASASINARTGEVISFYRDMNINTGDKAKYNEAQSKQAVEEFLKSFSPDKFKEVEYDEGNTDYIPYGISAEEQKSFSFNYIRKVNDAYFPSNTINVSFDAVAGEISSFSLNWFDVQFPSLDKALDVSKVYEKLFDEIGLELQYKAKYPQEYYSKGIMPQGGKPDVKLVYALKPGKPQFFDAATGSLLGDDGKPYKENKPVIYTDIKGHGAEKQITALSEYGISFEGPEFRPDASVTQLDFFVLLSKTLNYYYGPAITATSGEDDINNLYRTLIREGIIKEKEKNPSGFVTKEEAAKYMIRAMKLDKAAEIKGIFNCNFKDKDKIDADLVGYVTIAQGLKILNGNNGLFNPKAKLTRAQTAIIIYNYLQG